VHESGQRIRRRKLRRRPGGGRLKRLDDLNVALDEFGAKLSELVIVEIVLDGERLERACFDQAALLGFVEERTYRYLKNVAQFSSLPLLRPRRRSGWGRRRQVDSPAARTR
jgi:hypothetical protein